MAWMRKKERYLSPGDREILKQIAEEDALAEEWEANNQEEIAREEQLTKERERAWMTAELMSRWDHGLNPRKLPLNISLKRKKAAHASTQTRTTLPIN